nr:retrovirus-related Pol polyprotein from transposon TNT 1-94 [Tanacetum cinerariifolium]
CHQVVDIMQFSPPITGNFMPPKPDLVFNTAPLAVESDHSAFNVQVSPAKHAQAMSYTTESMAPIIKDWVSDSEDESEPNNPQNVSVQPIEVPILATTPKPTIQTSSSVLPKSKPIYVTSVRQVSAVVPKIMKSRPRPAHPLNRKSNPSIRRYKTHNQFSETSNSSLKVTVAKVSVVSAVKGKKGKWGNLQHALKDKGVIDSRCSRHMIRNISYLSDFQELNGGYVALEELKFNLFSVSQMRDKKNKVLFTDSKCLVLSPDFKLPDENQVLLRVPKEMLLPLIKPQNKTSYELLHGRPLSIGFMRPFGCHVTILNTLDSLGKLERKVDEGFLVGYSVNSKAFRVFNSRTCIVQETLHVNFIENKANITGTGSTWLFDIDSLTRTMNYQPVTAGNQSNTSAGSTNLQNKDGDATFDGEQDDITKKRHKGKSPVDYFTRNRDLNEDFEDYSKDSSNDVSTAGHIVPIAGQNYFNSTNPIIADGPLNSNTSPIHGNSSFQDASQSHDMPENEDIVYSDHENVGAEADFNNLETSITISPIPTTRIHNAHPIS